MNDVAEHAVAPFRGFFPVLTFRFPLDALLTPYVLRLCRGALISVPELRWQGGASLPALPLLIDSGGFAALSAGSSVEEHAGLGVLHLADGASISPQDVHAAQQKHAALGFTLDFPGQGPDAQQRARLSLANAQWALAQPRTFPLYASVQPGAPLRPYLAAAPDGIALGGLAPFSGQRLRLAEEVGRVRSAMPAGMPLHVFGIGHPDSIRTVMQAGATSTDSSAPQRTAAAGRQYQGPVLDDPAPHERLGLAVQNLRASLQAGLA